MKKLLFYIALFFAAMFLMATYGCSSTKHVTRDKTKTDSTGATQSKTVIETITHKQLDTSIIVPISSIRGFVMLGDTAIQSFESENLEVIAKVNLETHKVTFEAKTKPKTIQVKVNEDSHVTAKYDSSSKTQLSKKEVAIKRDVHRSGIPWWLWVVGGLVTVASIAFWIWKKKAKVAGSIVHIAENEIFDS